MSAATAEKFVIFLEITRPKTRQRLNVQKWMYHQEDRKPFVYHNIDLICLHYARNSQVHQKSEATLRKVWKLKYTSVENINVLEGLNSVKIGF